MQALHRVGRVAGKFRGHFVGGVCHRPDGAIGLILKRDAVAASVEETADSPEEYPEWYRYDGEIGQLPEADMFHLGENYSEYQRSQYSAVDR